MKEKDLVELAMQVRAHAYATYSKFLVGAALETDAGEVFVGCNVENASFGATCCAERVAFGAAISAGKQRFSRIAIVGGTAGQAPTHACMPCGICRQVMREFCQDDFEILVSDGKQILSYTLGELLPSSFAGSTMEEST